MHDRPIVVTYGNRELADLLGPVETQYCDVSFVPQGPLPSNQETALVVDYSGTPGFDLVEIKLTEPDGEIHRWEESPGGGGFNDEEKMVWGYEDFFGQEGFAPPGVWRIEVRLVEDGDEGEPCSTSIELLPLP